MPNIKLEFSLPEEQTDFELAYYGSKWWSIVYEMDNWFRSRLKYGHEFKSADDALMQAREYLRDLIREEGLNLE